MTTKTAHAVEAVLECGRSFRAASRAIKELGETEGVTREDLAEVSRALSVLRIEIAAAVQMMSSRLPSPTIKA